MQAGVAVNIFILTSEKFIANSQGHKYDPRLVWLLVFAVSWLVIGLSYQRGSSYTLAVGSQDAENLILSGVGDRENNGAFAFRWTLGQAILQIPELAQGNDIKLVVSPGPRPASAPLTTFTVQLDHAAPVSLVLPPLDSQGFAIVSVPGPGPNLRLAPTTLTISSNTFQPPGETRTLGLVLREIIVQTRPGLKLPPLAPWFGLSLLLTLIFVLAYRFIPLLSGNQTSSRYMTRIMGHKTNLLPYLVWLLALAVAIGIVLLKPNWLALNGGPLTWGAAGVLLIATLSGREILRTTLAAGWLGLSLILVFEGAVSPVLGIAAWATTVLVWGGFVVAGGFKQHYNNVVWLAAATLGATWGLWQGRLPRTDDMVAFHLYWFNELDRLMRQGNFYPRWASDFSYGQGNAVFNYYAPGGRYLVELFHLSGLTFNNAAMLTQIIAVIIGAIGTYFWCYEVFPERRAAILGGLAWVFFPFTIADLYVGGGLSNTLGSAVLPYVFLLLLRLIRQCGNWRTALVTGIALGSLFLSHTPLTLLVLPVGVVFCLGLLVLEYSGRPAILKTLVGLVLAGAVGVGFSAIFILPALFEKNLVPFSYADFRGNSYAPWPDALALWRPIYPNLDNYGLFGTLHPLLALTGLLLLWWRKAYRLAIPLWLGGLLLGLLVLQLPVSAFVWDAFPLFKSVQFTSRLMPFVAVMAAPLIGGLIIRPRSLNSKTLVTNQLPTNLVKTDLSLPFGRGILRYVPAMLAVFLMIWACLGQLRFSYWPASFDGSLSLKALQQQIKNGDPKYIPQTVTDLNAIQTFRQPAFADNRPLSSQDSLQLEQNGPINRRLLVKTSSQAQIIVPIFYYPGWHALVDGRELAIKPTAGTGLITFELPPGNQIVNLDFQDTPIRLISDILSFLTVVGLLSVAFFSRKPKD